MFWNYFVLTIIRNHLHIMQCHNVRRNVIDLHVSSVIALLFVCVCVCMFVCLYVCLTPGVVTMATRTLKFDMVIPLVIIWKVRFHIFEFLFFLLSYAPFSIFLSVFPINWTDDYGMPKWVRNLIFGIPPNCLMLKMYKHLFIFQKCEKITI